MEGMCVLFRWCFPCDFPLTCASGGCFLSHQRLTELRRRRPLSAMMERWEDSATSNKGIYTLSLPPGGEEEGGCNTGYSGTFL
jgi:hypothetical protein